MAVYKHGAFYRYEFQINGRRFFGPAKTKNKKDALAVEVDARRQVAKDLEQERRTGTGPLTLDVAAGRYWEEVGQHHANHKDTFANLGRLIAYFGKDKRLDAITDSDMAAIVAWRRSQTIKGRTADKNGDPVRTVTPSTVNRTVTVLLKSIFARAKRTWRYSLPDEPNWRAHMLKEPQERVRELHGGEASALDLAVREDYALWFRFARLTGLRRNETLIRWKNVGLDRITTTGKGGKTVTTPITPAVRAILEQCRGHHPEYVFTFIARRPRKGQVKGQRYPITQEGAKTQWRRLRSRAKVEDFRFHDLRHDVATKLLRATGNLKLVQRALNHSNIATTTKYAHVVDDEVAAALTQIASPTIIPTTELKKAG